MLNSFTYVSNIGSWKSTSDKIYTLEHCLYRMLICIGIDNQILMPRVWSLDGLGKCPKGFWEVWVPFTTSSPGLLYSILLRVSVWRESMRQSSTLRIKNHNATSKDTPETLALRLKAVNLLNARLRNSPVDDECVTSVAFFAFTEVGSSIMFSCGRY
jgi:hypothetical protein